MGSGLNWPALSCANHHAWRSKLGASDGIRKFAIPYEHNNGSSAIKCVHLLCITDTPAAIANALKAQNNPLGSISKARPAPVAAHMGFIFLILKAESDAESVQTAA